MREARWLTGHPKAEESCVFISLFEKISGKNSSLGTSVCSEKKQFICEASLKFGKYSFEIYLNSYLETQASKGNFADQLGVFRNLEFDGR